MSLAEWDALFWFTILLLCNNCLNNESFMVEIVGTKIFSAAHNQFFLCNTVKLDNVSENDKQKEISFPNVYQFKL